MKDIKDILKYLEESDLWKKSVCKRIKNEKKEQEGGFLGMLTATLGASLLGNMLPGEAKISGRRVIRAGEGTISAAQDF